MSHDELTVQLIDANGEALRVCGVHLDLRFYTEGRFRYSYSLGRTDAHGVSRTTLQDIQRQLEANQRLFLMDYNTPLADCDTLVGIVAPSMSELVEREAARAKWWPNDPSTYVGASNGRVRCREQRFELHRGRGNSFDLVCDVERAD